MANAATKKVVARTNGKEATNGQRGLQSAADTPPANGNGLCRTTAVLPEILNANWNLYALKVGTPKNDILVDALREYLVNRGFKADRIPIFDVSWHD